MTTPTPTPERPLKGLEAILQKYRNTTPESAPLPTVASADTLAEFARLRIAIARFITAARIDFPNGYADARNIALAVVAILPVPEDIDKATAIIAAEIEDALTPGDEA